MSKKFDNDEAIQKYVAKKVDAAVKAERRRVADAVKALPLASYGSKKDATAMMRLVKGAISAPQVVI